MTEEEEEKINSLVERIYKYDVIDIEEISRQTGVEYYRTKDILWKLSDEHKLKYDTVGITKKWQELINNDTK